jgi:hypothetical protein
MYRRFLRHAFFAKALVATAFVIHGAPATAQTKPALQIPPENQGQANAIVDQLLKEGRIIRSSSVKRGMMGYALSVFQGTKIEKFPIVVLGTLERVQGGGDIVLIKVLGGPVVERNSGIVAGMSGSPVYINGKMLGAIALGWPFPKEPIGGVTPITEMIETSLPNPARAKPRLSALDSLLPPSLNLTREQATYKPNAPLSIAGRRIAKVEVSRDNKRQALHGPSDGATMTMRPVNTVLQVSGFSERSMPLLKQMFEPYQISPVIGPSSKKTVPAPPIAPGSAMGVQLVSGDMDQTAIGTVTFRWGNRILGFGHPMFGQGSSSLPLTSAYVHEFFPSYQRSFKLASPIAVAGAVQQDTQFAVGGTLHAKADTIPMKVTVNEAARNIAKTYQVQVMKDPILTPQLIVMVASEAIQTKLGTTSDKMVRVNMRLDIENAPPVIRSNVLYASDTVTKAALLDLTQSLMISQSNEFTRGSVKRVELKVDVTEGRNIALVKAMTVNKNKVKAGETFTVNVVLQPVGAPNKPVTRSFDFTVPVNTPDGMLRLAAAASVNYWPLQVRVGGAPPDPANLRELITAWNKVGSFNELMVQASTTQAYLQVGDQKIANPAPSWAKLMGSARTTNVGAFNEVEVRRATTPYMLDGAQVLTIPIESADSNGQTSPASAEADAGQTTDTPTIPGENPAPALPGLSDENAGEGENSAVTFTAPPVNGRWGNFDNGKAWDELYATPPLLNAVIKSNARFGPSTLQSQPQQQQVAPKPATPTTAATPVAPAPTTTPAPTATPTPTPTPTTPAFGAGKSVARPALSWTQTGVAEFLKGKFDGAFVTSNGEIRVSPAVKTITQTNEPFVWSIAGDKQGNTYLGTGLFSNNKARILKVDAAGKQTVFWEGNGVAVTALVVDTNDQLYAAVAPGGKVLRFSEDGKRTGIFATGHNFVWSIQVNGANKLLIATGGEQGGLLSVNTADASLWKTQPGTLLNPAIAVQKSQVVSVPQKHIRAISVRGDEIFLGTGSDGVLYRYNQNSKQLDALWQAGDAKTTINSEILAVAAAPEGVYFGTSLNGTLYRWSENNGVEALYPSPQKAVYAIERLADGNLYAATGDSGVVYQVQPGQNTSDTRVARVLEPDQRQALSLAKVEDALLVGTGNGGGAYRFNFSSDNAGIYTSPVFDSKSQVNWGTLRFIGHDAGIETRSGNTAEPDATWSDWQPTHSNDLGELSIVSPSTRYLQYRVRVQQSPNSSTKTPYVSRVEVIYRASNSAPDVAIGLPQGGAFWNGTKKITWNGKDPNNDTLQYNVEVSSDDGKNWKRVGAKDLKTMSVDWDTKKNPDGTYRVRVLVDDALANADDPKSAEAVSLPLTIDNTAPVVEATLVKDGNNWRLIASANDATSPISGAEWRFAVKKKKEDDSAKTETASVAPAIATDKPATPAVAGTSTTNSTAAPKPKATPKDGAWRAVSASDSIFDSRHESLTALISPLFIPTRSEEESVEETISVTVSTDATAQSKSETSEPEYQFELRVFDAAGNSTTLTLDLP